MIRSFALALAALLFTPTAALAEDSDEICVLWVHSFAISEEPKKSVFIETETTCAWRASSLGDPDGEPYEDGKPYRGEGPEASVERECKLLGDRIVELEETIAQAKELLPAAIAARDAAGDIDKLKYYGRTRIEWEAARGVLDDAKRAYEAAYGVDPVIERDDYGRITKVVREYDIDTPLGRAVVDAMKVVAEAEETMNAAWAATGGKAQAEQRRVDQYNSVLKTYPPELARAKARFEALGCS
jgi:hypothetical protein